MIAVGQSSLAILSMNFTCRRLYDILLCIRYTTVGPYGPTLDGRPRHRPMQVVRVSWNGRVGPEAEAEVDMGPLDCMRYSGNVLSAYSQ